MLYKTYNELKIKLHKQWGMTGHYMVMGVLFPCLWPANDVLINSTEHTITLLYSGWSMDPDLVCFLFSCFSSYLFDVSCLYLPYLLPFVSECTLWDNTQWHCIEEQHIKWIKIWIRSVPVRVSCCLGSTLTVCSLEPSRLSDCLLENLLGCQRVAINRSLNYWEATLDFQGL